MRAPELHIAQLRLAAGDTLVVQAHTILSKDQRDTLTAYVRSKVSPDVRVMVLSNDVELSVLGAFKEVEQPVTWKPAPWWQFWRPASGAAGGAVVVALTLGAIFALAAHHIHAG